MMNKKSFIEIFFKKYPLFFKNWELLYNKNNINYNLNFGNDLSNETSFEKQMKLIKDEIYKSEILSKKLKELFYDFIYIYFKYNQDNIINYDYEMKIINKYWDFVNHFKNETIDFNKSIIYLNKHFYYKQKGFKRNF